MVTRAGGTTKDQKKKGGILIPPITAISVEAEIRA
jgi:hypothetical protein